MRWRVIQSRKILIPILSCLQPFGQSRLSSNKTALNRRIARLTMAMETPVQSVKAVNGKHLQALEEAMTTLLAHPLFDAVQAMAPQAICGTASKEEAGSQAAGGE